MLRNCFHCLPSLKSMPSPRKSSPIEWNKSPLTKLVNVSPESACLCAQ